MTDYTALARAHARRWAAMHINDGKSATFDSVARRLVAPEAKKRYQKISKKTGVPWWVIAVIHEREASQRWDRSIAQGDPFCRVSRNVPKGRGPFDTFEDAAYDALVNCGPFAARNEDWSIGGTLTLLEKYNGMGYANRGIPSPYIWAGSDQYSRGKFVRDHVFDPNAVDKQLGCAGLLARMAALDSSIKLDGKQRGPKPPTAPAVVVGGGAAAAGAAASGHHWVAIVILLTFAAGAGYLAYKKWFKK